MSRSEWLFGDDGTTKGPIPVGELKKALQGVPDDLEIFISVGPDYEEIALTGAIVAAKHGSLFLIGEVVEEDEEEDAVLEATYEVIKESEASAILPFPEDNDFIPDGAEAA